MDILEFLPQLLKNKKIILGVCGSVAIYKSLELIRILQKLGANVRVVLSQSAQEFINPLLFEAISKNKVLTKESQSWDSTNALNHIEITDADAFIIAPASVNSINKIACGICDTILLESFIAFDKIKLLAPAANTKMLKNSITQENLKKLKNLGVKIIRPQVKELACGIVGNGALAEPLEIAFNIIKALLKDSFFKDKSILITAGGSKEAIDSVRYISNYSSGKMGYALALCAYFLGAKTTLISPTLPFNLPLEINYKKAESSKEFLENIKNWQKDLKDSALSYLFMSAAISDYVPEKIADKKLKKQEIGKEWNLKLKQNLDILKSIEKNQNTIGFKLESSQNAESLAKTALEKKGLNAICLNRISDNFNPLDSNQNEITFITKDSSILLPLSDKITLSFKILQEVKKL